MKHLYKIRIYHRALRSGTDLRGEASNATDAVKRALAWARREKEGLGPHSVVRVKLLGKRDF